MLSKKLIYCFLIFFILFSSVFAGDTQLRFDSSPDPSVVGYKIYWDYNDGTDSGFVNLNLATTHNFGELVPGNYKFFATAYDADGFESEPSNTLEIVIESGFGGTEKIPQTYIKVTGPLNIRISE
jgi:hypothetical protein